MPFGMSLTYINVEVPKTQINYTLNYHFNIHVKLTKDFFEV